MTEMRHTDGTLTSEAVEILNRAARDRPFEVYPLSRLAADMGRAKLLVVVPGLKLPSEVGGPVTARTWSIYVADDGWSYVTDPEALARHRREVALKRLQSSVPTATGDSRLGPIFHR